MEEIVNFKVSVSCDKRGSQDVAAPEPQSSLDEISCNACGAKLGTHLALDEHIEKEVHTQLTEQLDALLRA